MGRDIVDILVRVQGLVHAGVTAVSALLFSGDQRAADTEAGGATGNAY